MTGDALRRPVRRARRRSSVTVAVALVASYLLVLVVPGASGAGATPADVLAPWATERARSEAACATSTAPVLDLPEGQAAPWPATGTVIAEGTVVDLRGRALDNGLLNASGFGLGAKFRPGSVGAGLCLLGGTIWTGLDAENTSWNTWHRVTGLTVETAGFRVVGTRFRNQGDAIAFVREARDWEVIGVRADGDGVLPLASIHDDCVEDDGMNAGRIVDSKFDGCNTFLSATHSSERAVDGTGNTVEVRDTLVRLQPYRNSFNVPKYGENRHGGFFKWARTDSDVMIPPALVVTDSVFRADDPAVYGGNENGMLGLPPGTRCERVVLIGTESWPADDLRSWQDQCTDLRLGTEAEWDAAVADWDASHPPMRDLPGKARDLVTAASGW